MASALRSQPRAAVAALAALALLAVAVFAGGVPGSLSVAAIGAAALVLAATGAALYGLPRLDRAGLVAVGALLVLVAWSAASMSWSFAADRSWDAANALLVYAAFLACGLVFARALGERAPEALAAVLAVVTGAALLWALLGVAVPALAEQGDRIARLSEPVGYWNALALLAGVALALGAWAGASVEPARRLAGALLVYVATVAVLLTQSRAGVVAFAVVVGLWVWLAPARGAAVLGLALAIVPAGAVAGWAFTRPALVEDGAGRAARVDDGAWFAVIAVAGAVVVAILALRLDVAGIAARRPRALRRVVAVAVAAVVAAGAVGLVTGAREQLSRTDCASHPGRLNDLCTNNRFAWWGEALELARAHPLRGTGDHTFAVARTRVRDTGDDVTQPHSLPFQVLSDLGVVGLVLLAVCAAAIALAVVRVCRRRRRTDPAVLPLSLALLVFALHTVVDYDADFLAVSGPVLLVTGVLLAQAAPGRPRAFRWLPVALAGLGAAGLVSLALPWLSDRALDAADRAAGAEAVRHADRAISLNPWSFEAHLVRAQVALGDEDAARAYERLTALQPENADGWYFRGLFELSLRGEPNECSAYFALNESYTRDPVNGTRWSEGGALDRARAAVNDPFEPACGRG